MLQALQLLLVICVMSLGAFAQDPSQSGSPVQATPDKRVFGVLPNNRTTENSIPFQAITAKQNPKLVHAGALLFNNHCYFCHGLNAVAGPLPDLRYSSKEVLDSFASIVLDGARASAGMPSYKKILSVKEVEAIREYVIARAQETAKPMQAPQPR